MTGSPRVAVLGGGIAGLATAFDLEFEARRKNLPLTLTVFEAAGQAGGHLQTLAIDGFRLEHGPNGFLDSEPETLRLVNRAGLHDSLQRSENATRRRFLLIDGKICELPTSPRSFLRSKILSWPAKLRLAGELFVPPRRQTELAADETVFDFGCRRLGRAFAETMLDPMVKGISGGDSRRLSLAAAFPRIAELEARYGSLLKAMISLQRSHRQNRGQGGAGGPSGTLHSFQEGMADLPTGLVRSLRGEVRCNAAVTRVEGPVGGYFITTESDGGIRRSGPFAAVVDATPAHAAARHHTDSRLCRLLGEIPWAPLAVVTLAFGREDITHDLDGFGMLIPSQERRRLLGVLWSASIFTGRAPADTVLLRCMVGGATDPAAIEVNDTALVERCLSEVSGLFGIKGAPQRTWIFRHQHAIAQYETGHLARLAAIDRILDALPGLYLTGGSYRGIAVNHCAADAARTAGRVISFLAKQYR